MAGGDPAGRRYLVSGLVQGVGFRWTAQRVARSLGITGSVRNRPDGRVEIKAHGAPDALDLLRRELRTGMPGRVEAVREEAIQAGQGEAPDDFRVVF